MYTFIIIRMDTKYVYIYYYTHVYSESGLFRAFIIAEPRI